MDDDFEHPTLGVFRREGAQGWLGRSDPGPDFFDLFIMTPEDDAPPARALEHLEQAKREIETLKADAVRDICAARQARLNWRAGPSVEAWSIVEARIDQAGALWLNLHEYETDEYSRWLIRVSDRCVRRIPALPFTGAPADAGVLV